MEKHMSEKLAVPSPHTEKRLPPLPGWKGGFSPFGDLVELAGDEDEWRENTKRRSTARRVDVGEWLHAGPTHTTTEVKRLSAAVMEVPDLTQNNTTELSNIKGLRFVALITALCLAVFCMALDNTIIAAAIPRITDEFHAIADVAWYISAYLLTTCAFQLFFGRLYTFFNIKIVFLVAMALFEVGSTLCGAAPNSVGLIVGRAIAGLGSAGIFSGAIIIMANIVPLRQRPIYIGLAGSMYGIASVVGPLLGGIFTDHLTWRWCFYINLPIGAITIGFVVLFLPASSGTNYNSVPLKEKIRRLDLIGTAIFVPGIICLILALQWGGLDYAWSDGRIIGLLVVFGLTMVAFCVDQWWQQDDGTVPPRVMFQRSVAGAAWWAWMFGGSFFILIYYVPIWFQAVWGISATQSGIDSLPLVLACSVFCGLSGMGIYLFGYFTPWLIAASVVMSIGSGLISTFYPAIPASKWIGYQLLGGAGFGMGIQIPLITVQVVLPMDDVPTGTALIMFSQMLGGAVSIAIAQNVFLQQLARSIEGVIPGFTVQALYASGGATTIRNFVSGETLDLLLRLFSESLQSAFHVSTALAALSIIGALFVEWKSVKGQFLIGVG